MTVTIPSDSLGAFCRENNVEAEPAGAGPLDGLTFAIKDVFDVAGSRTGFGQPSWLASHEPATSTAPVVSSLLETGARLVGRTVSDELTYSLTGENAHYGTPGNPRCPDRVPGGSSSGSASAVAGGLCDFALGTDCAGSVRIPASYCGVYGMRPTHGRVPLDGVCPFAPSFDTVGWFARDTAVLACAGRVLLNDERLDRPEPISQVLVASDAFDLVGPEVAEALQDSVAVMRAGVGQSAEVTVTNDGLGRWMECFGTIQAFEIWRSLGSWVERERPQLGPGVRERFERAARVRPEDVELERRFRHGMVERLEGLIPPGSALVLPTAPGIAPPRNAPTDEVEVVFRARAISLLCVAGLGGLPQVSIPAAELSACPLGLSLVGARYADRALLDLVVRLAADSATVER